MTLYIRSDTGTESRLGQTGANTPRKPYHSIINGPCAPIPSTEIMTTKPELVPEPALPSDPALGVRRLFDRYHNLIFNLCSRMLDQVDDAEDITQDVFLKAFKAYDGFRAEASHGTWLYRIAVNLCLNHRRRQKTVRWLSLDIFADAFDTAPFESHAPGPDELVQQSETERIVRRALNELPARQRAAIILARYEELSYKEISRVLECSEASIESLLHRAKLNLAKHLKPYLDSLQR